MLFFLSQTLGHGCTLNRRETLPQTNAMIKTQNVHVGYCSVRNLFVRRALSWFSCETFLCRGRTCYKTRPSWPILKPQRARSLKTPVLELKRL